MGMYTSEYIFQAKLYGILGDTNVFKIYTDHIFILSKDNFKNI